MAIRSRIGRCTSGERDCFSETRFAAAGNTADEKKTVAADEIFVDLTKEGSPGCALGVYRDGKMVYSKGSGLANLEQNVPINTAKRVRTSAPLPSSSQRRAFCFWKSRANSRSTTTYGNTFLNFRITDKK